MPGRRHFRGPRRPPQALGEGSAPQAEPAPRPTFAGDDSTAAAAPGEGPRRRRHRGGRGRRPDRLEGATGPSTEAVTPPPAEGEADRDPARRKRRRRGGRNRHGPGEPLAAGGVEAEAEEEASGQPPADYISFQVERGTPRVYVPETALVPVEYEEDIEAARPSKARRINSGKLFWYIRSKSYVPIPELRRRFEIAADEMGTIQDNGQRMYVGLPQDVADVVANLRRQNKIGLETAPEFSASVVVGVFPIFR